MVAISGPSLGYAGSITETTGKDYWNRVGASKYGVVGSGDLKVSTTTGDRMLLVASGIAWGHNIQDTLATSVSVQLNSVASGSRYDLVVVRRDVTAKTSIEVVQGTGSKAIPSLTTTAASHADQPIALCRVDAGSTTVQEIIDLRCWAANGGVLAVDKMAQDYLATPGANVHINGINYVYKPDNLGQFSWQAQNHTQGNLVVVPISNGADLGSVQVTFPVPFPSAPSVTLTKATTSGPLSSLRRLQPVAKGVTATGFTAYIETNDGQGVGAAFNVDCFYTAVQRG